MKTETISIRVTPEQKASIKEEARKLNMNVSEYLKNNGAKIGGPKSYREQVQKMVELSESLTSLEYQARKEPIGELAEKIESDISLLNYILKTVYASQDFQQYKG